MLPTKIRILMMYPMTTLILCCISPAYLFYAGFMWCLSGQWGFDWLLWIVVKLRIPLYPITQEDSRIERELMKQEGRKC